MLHYVNYWVCDICLHLLWNKNRKKTSRAGINRFRLGWTAVLVYCSCLSELSLHISAKNNLTMYSSRSLRAWLTSVLESVEQRQITLDALFPPILHSNCCGLQTANSLGPCSYFLYTEVNPTYSPCVWWNYTEFSIRLESNPWTIKLILCCKQLWYVRKICSASIVYNLHWCQLL